MRLSWRGSAPCATCGAESHRSRWRLTPALCPSCESLGLIPERSPLAAWTPLLTALAVAAGAIAAVWQLDLVRPFDATSVAMQAGQAFHQKQYGRALELLQRLEARQELDPTTSFQQAQCLAAVGRRGEARRQVVDLVGRAGTWFPHNAPLMVDAHYWLASEIYAQPKITRTQWRAAEGHLRTVLHYSPDHEAGRRMLVAMLEADGELAEAIPHRERLATESLEDRMALAATYERLGRKSLAKEASQSVLASLLADLSERPHDIARRRQAARAAWLARDFATAEAQLQLALKWSDCADAETILQLAELHESWANHIPPNRPDWDRAALEHLRTALELAPRRLKTYESLKRLMFQPGAVGEEARALAHMGLSRGCEPAGPHGLLAEWHGQNGKGTASAMHWRVVVDRQPDWSGALNNLAWELCWCDPPKLQDALDFVQQAIKLEPRSPAFRETRGQVLARMGRPREALPDLLAAVSVFASDPRLHRTLGEVYRDLGRGDEAALHEEAARTLIEATRSSTEKRPAEGSAQGVD